jgi:hypothetical protein
VYPEPTVPPLPAALAVPVLAPKHKTFVCVGTDAVNADAGCVTVVVAVAVHPFASVTVTVYVLAASPVAVAALPPEGAQLYVYPDPTVPPLPDAFAVPLLPPKQDTLVCVGMEAASAEAGCVIVIVVVPGQPLLSRIFSV